MTRIQFDKIVGGKVPADWHERILEIWSEDECLLNDPSAEHLADAVTRLVGTMYNCVKRFRETDDGEGVKRLVDQSNDLLGPVIDSYDGGDCLLQLHRYGWVTTSSPWGLSLGRVVKTESR